MVTALEIKTRAQVLGGKTFGNTGAYEKIIGTLRFAIDPTHPLHRCITDIDLAPKNAEGRVEFSGDFYLLKPVDASKGNRRLLLDVCNRGRKVALGVFNSATRVPDPERPEDFGNGFLMRHGYTVAWIGWQPDVPSQDGLMRLDAPRAQGVTGYIRCERRPNTLTDTLPLADRYHVPHPTVDTADALARLTVRKHAGASAVEVPREDWCFSDARHIRLKGGFAPGAIYTIVYQSDEVPLVGLGFLAVRDTAAWLRWGSSHERNPCAGAIDRSYLFGLSQSGRFVRHLLHLGLDEDEGGRMVFEAVMPHVAGARRGEFNLRLGQPSLNVHDAVGSLPPFNDEALYERVRQRGRTPRIFAMNSSPEYWRGDASLIHTDIEGQRDAEPAEFARTYAFAGTQHTPGPLPPLEADASTGSRGLNRFNVVDYAPLLRAALVNLDQWVSADVEPPPSAFPRIADGTAVEAESLGAYYRSLPGVRFPDVITRPTRLDFGPELERGIATYPPRVGAAYRTYVSAIDADGNEIAGIRPPELVSPLATFAGWNTRHPEEGAAGDLMSMMGSTFPFALTRAQRERTRDPRPSIAERYASRAAYLDAVRENTNAQVSQRHVLAEDVEAIVARAGLRWDWIHSIGDEASHS
jgi:Alpha/beta hydrolase domain